MVVLWRVSTACNLACGFCAYDRRLPFPRTAADPLEVLRFGRLLAAHGQQAGRPILLSWLGGEPLLWPPLRALDAQLAGSGLALSLTSNGTALGSASVRRHLLRHYRELTLSLDAPGIEHDRLRGWRGGHDRLLGHLRTLVQERADCGAALKLRVNSVLLRDTLASYPALARELAAAGVDELSFNALGGRDRPEFFAAQALLPDQWTAFVEQLPALRCELASRGTRLVGSAAYLQRIGAAVQGRDWPVDDCAPGTDFLFIDETGRISPCSQTSAEYGIPLQSVRTPEQLADLPRQLAVLRRQRRAASCDDCPSTQVFGKFRAAPAAAPRPANMADIVAR